MEHSHSWPQLKKEEIYHWHHKLPRFGSHCYCSCTYEKQTNKSQASVINKLQRSKHFHMSDFACFLYLYYSIPLYFPPNLPLCLLSFLFIASICSAMVKTCFLCYIFIFSQDNAHFASQSMASIFPPCSFRIWFDPHMRSVIYIKHNTNIKITQKYPNRNPLFIESEIKTMIP